MQTLHEQGLGAKAIIFSYPDKGWKLSTVKESAVESTTLAQPFCVPGSCRPATYSASILEHSDSRFESIRLFVLGESIRIYTFC